MSTELHSTDVDANYSRDIGIGIGIALVTASVGAYFCAFAVNRFGEMGALSAWLLGWLSGEVARAVMSQPRKVVGYTLAAAVVLAMLIAEVCWIRWNIEDVNSWGEAVALLPQFCQQFQWSAILAGLAAFFGASSAYRRAGVRYRLVQVVDE